MSGGLRKQDRGIDAGGLTPLSLDIISRQATINIGTVGHVAHGKSTTVKALTGVNVRCAPVCTVMPGSSP